MSMPVTRPAAAIAVRDAVAGDVPAIREIYACHVRYGFVSFEEVPPDEAEMERRRQEVLLRKLPYLVIEREGQVCGFAYASPFGPRPACRYTVEDSVYIAPGTLGQGFGRWALAELINRCTALDLRHAKPKLVKNGSCKEVIHKFESPKTHTEAWPAARDVRQSVGASERQSVVEVDAPTLGRISSRESFGRE